MHKALDWNRPKYTPIAGGKWDPKKAHQESWFIKANNQKGEAIWLKFTILHNTNGKNPEFEVWGMIFPAADSGKSVCAVKQTYEQENAAYSDSPDELTLRFSENLFHQILNGELKTNGDISSKNCSMQWELQLQGTHPPITLFPYDQMYQWGFPKRKPVSPFFIAECTGQFIYSDGKTSTTINFDHSPAMQGHNWGSEHSHRYVCCHAYQMKDKKTGHSAIFEGYSGKIKIAFIVSPWLTGLYLEPDDAFVEQTGVTAFDLRGAEFFLNNSVKADYNKMQWSWKAEKDGWILEGNFSAPLKSTAGLNYYDPDGKLNYCYNSKIASGTIKVTKKTGGELLREYHTDNMVSIEFLTDQKHQTIPIIA